jgi:hypothetical protein
MFIWMFSQTEFSQPSPSSLLEHHGTTAARAQDTNQAPLLRNRNTQHDNTARIGGEPQQQAPGPYHSRDTAMDNTATDNTAKPRHNTVHVGRNPSQRRRQGQYHVHDTVTKIATDNTAKLRHDMFALMESPRPPAAGARAPYCYNNCS